MKEIIIKSASNLYASELASFMNNIESENLPYLLSFGFLFDKKIQLKYIKKFKSTKNAYLLIAIKQNKIIGALDFMPFSNSERLHCGRLGLLIRKDERRSGVGTLLFNKLQEKLKKSEIKRIEVEIVSSNIAVKRFNDKLGFIIEGKKNDAINKQGEYFDLISMAFEIKR